MANNIIKNIMKTIKRTKSKGDHFIFSHFGASDSYISNHIRMVYPECVIHLYADSEVEQAGYHSVNVFYHTDCGLINKHPWSPDFVFVDVFSEVDFKKDKFYNSTII